MKAKNQLVVLSGILVLLATATIAATYNVQTAKAAFGKDIVVPQANGKTGTPGGAGFGAHTSNLAHGGGVGDLVKAAAKQCAGPPGTC